MIISNILVARSELSGVTLPIEIDEFVYMGRCRTPHHPGTGPFRSPGTVPEPSELQAGPMQFSVNELEQVWDRSDWVPRTNGQKGSEEGPWDPASLQSKI